MINNPSDAMSSINECLREVRHLGGLQNLRNTSLAKRELHFKFAFIDSLSIEQDYGLYARDIISLAFKEVITKNSLNNSAN